MSKLRVARAEILRGLKEGDSRLEIQYHIQTYKVFKMLEVIYKKEGFNKNLRMDRIYKICGALEAIIEKHNEAKRCDTHLNKKLRLKHKAFNVGIFGANKIIEFVNKHIKDKVELAISLNTLEIWRKGRYVCIKALWGTRYRVDMVLDYEIVEADTRPLMYSEV